MNAVNVSIGTRSYRIACAEGEEERISRFAKELDHTLASMKARTGDIGETALLVMAAITVLDRLDAAETRIAALNQETRRLAAARDEAAIAADEANVPVIERVEAATAAINTLADLLTSRLKPRRATDDAAPADIRGAPLTPGDPFDPDDLSP